MFQRRPAVAQLLGDNGEVQPGLRILRVQANRLDKTGLGIPETPLRHQDEPKAFLNPRVIRRQLGRGIQCPLGRIQLPRAEQRVPQHVPGGGIGPIALHSEVGPQ